MLTSSVPVSHKKGARALCLPNTVLRECQLLFLLCGAILQLLMNRHYMFTLLGAC